MTIEDHYTAIAPKLTNWLAATGSSHAEACDLVQETFLRIWRMRDDLADDPSSVSGLAFTIARNLRKNQWRDDSRLTFVDEIRDSDAGTAQPPDELPSEADERRAALRSQPTAAFAKLPPQPPRSLHPLPDRRNVHPRNLRPDRRHRKPRQSPHLPCQDQTPRNTFADGCNHFLTCV